MKSWMYPLFVILGACSYNLQRLLNWPLQKGIQRPSSDKPTFVPGLFIVSSHYLLPVGSFQSSAAALRSCSPVFIAAITGTVYGKAVSLMPASLAVVMLLQFDLDWHDF